MKILGVEFKNIHSFAGQWEVHFDRPPLSDTGLFAIVGPNGSGKSSILDAITLGLYGETARHKNADAKIPPWMADQSYAVVTFAVGDLQYRSEWRVKSRADGGEEPEMRLLQLNGGESLVEDRVIRVRSRVAELTGLDFKRFCRSILLAQGEFAAFLSALESERSEILEKIMGPEMQLELERSLRSKAADAGETLHQLKETAASFSIFERSRLSQAQQEQEQIQDELEQAEQALSELEQQGHWLERLEQLAAAELEASAAAASAKACHGDLHRQLLLLDQAEPARALAEDVGRLDQCNSEREAITNELSRLNEAIPTHENRLGELEQQVRTNLEEQEEARRQEAERADEWSSALLQDREIERKSQRFLDLVRDLEAKERARKQGLQRQAELDREIVVLGQQLQGRQRQLDDLAADQDLALDAAAIEGKLKRLIDLQQQIEHQQAPRAELLKVERVAAKALEKQEQQVLKLRNKASRLAMRRSEGAQRIGNLLDDKNLTDWKKLLKTSRNKRSLAKELVKIGKLYQEQQVNGNALDKLHRIDSQIQTVRVALVEEQTRLGELAEDIDWRDRVRRVAAERSELQAGAKCPLCGSTEHPFLEQETPNFSELDRIVPAQEKKIAVLQDQLDSLEATAAGVQQRAKEMDRLQQLWATTCERAGFAWTTPDAGLAQAEIRTQKAAIKDGKARIRSARWQNWRNGRFDRSLRRKEARLAQKELKADESRQRYHLAQQALATADRNIASLQQEDRMIRTELEGPLSRYRERSPGFGTEAPLLQRISERVRGYRQLSDEQKAGAARLQSLENEKLALADELQRVQQSTAVLTEETAGLERSLRELKAERTARFGDLDPTRERQAVEGKIASCTGAQAALQQEIQSSQQLLLEHQTRLTQLRQREQQVREALQEIQDQLEEQAAAAGFASLDQVRGPLALLQDEPRWKEQQPMVDQALSDAEAKAAALRDQLATLRAERKTDDPLAVIRQRLEDHGKHRDSLQERKNIIERLLLEQRAAERDYLELQRAIAEQEKVWAEATAAQGLLESPDGAEFKTRLQQLMLDRLIEHTNQYLAGLSSRYRLRTGEQNGFGFLISDSLQGKTHRSAKTLSGGETFIVSLCLALGLSDLASKHRKIESLFIDEGFGTLDDENLYRVIAALKGLRENGKTVGIISHVKKLADEIPTQIRVEKQANGMSRLTILA